MWDFLKKAGQQVLQAGVTYAQNRAFIASLFQGTQEDALRRLRERVQALDESGYNSFKFTLSGMIGEATRNLEQVKAAGGLGAWGNSVEDRMAQAMAEIRTGDHSASSATVQQAEQMVAGLQLVMQYAEAFRAETLSAPPAPAVAAAPANAQQPANARQPDAAEIERLLDQMAETGQMPEGLMEKLTQINDPELMERLVEKMKAMGGEEVGSQPLLNIKDYYVDGTALYALLWPLSPDLALPIPFEELDRSTQFHVLWGELSRRLTEGSALRQGGKLDEAEATFHECLERADQLEVPVLKSRAYEGLMTVAERRGDRRATERYLRLVEQEQDRQTARDAARK